MEVVGKLGGVNREVVGKLGEVNREGNGTSKSSPAREEDWIIPSYLEGNATQQDEGLSVIRTLPPSWIMGEARVPPDAL